MEVLWKGWKQAWYVRDGRSGVNAGIETAYITELALGPDQLAQVGGQVVAAVGVLDARRPVVLAGAHQHVLGVVGDEAVERGFAVNLEAGREGGRGGAGASRRGARRDGRERRGVVALGCEGPSRGCGCDRPYSSG